MAHRNRDPLADALSCANEARAAFLATAASFEHGEATETAFRKARDRRNAACALVDQLRAAQERQAGAETSGATRGSLGARLVAPGPRAGTEGPEPSDLDRLAIGTGKSRRDAA